MPKNVLNCWEFHQCGRDVFTPRRVDSVCPVSITTCHHGRNKGINAGRCCWMVGGTFSPSRFHPDRERGSMPFKETHCKGCAFRRLVESEQRFPRSPWSMTIPVQVQTAP